MTMMKTNYDFGSSCPGIIDIDFIARQKVIDKAIMTGSRNGTSFPY